MVRKILDRMQDEESKFLFEKKVESIVLENQNIFRTALMELDVDWKCDEIDELNNENNKNKKIYIFGAGEMGVASYLLLRKLKMDCRVVAFIDNDKTKWGQKLYGKDVISPYEPELLNDVLILISARKHNASQIFSQLMMNFSIDKKNIFYPRMGFLYANYGWQYFDMFSPNDNEIFIDGGANDGNSSVDFAKWTKYDYKGIYAFEPLSYMELVYRNTIGKNRISNSTFIQKGLWDSSGKLQFCEDGAGSKVSDNGISSIEVCSLDEILDGISPTFVKMDIEGSELKALKGARRTIEKCHPRMAISLYHKPEDIISIPKQILEINSSYHFYIRCYQSQGYEMVLYAE